MTIGYDFNGQDLLNLNKPSQISRAEIGSTSRIVPSQFFLSIMGSILLIEFSVSVTLRFRGPDP